LGLAAGWDFALWAISPLLAWHRDHFSGSVADAIHPRALDTQTIYDGGRDFSKSTEVPDVLLGAYNGRERCRMKGLFFFSLCAFLLVVFLQLEADSVRTLTRDYLSGDLNGDHIKDAAVLPFMALACNVAAARFLSEGARIFLTMLGPLLTVAVGINAAASCGLF